MDIKHTDDEIKSLVYISRRYERLFNIYLLPLLSAETLSRMTEEDKHFIAGFKSITVERYDEMLCVLPPEVMTGCGFLLGEPQDHNGPFNRPRYRAFLRTGWGETARYYESIEPMTVEAFHALSDEVSKRA